MSTTTATAAHNADDDEADAITDSASNAYQKMSAATAWIKSQALKLSHGLTAHERLRISLDMAAAQQIVLNYHHHNN